jgi:hypothetical protein
LLAGIDLVTGKVHVLVKDRHHSREFIEFLKLLDAAYPAHTAIKLILDNESAHISKREEAAEYVAADGLVELVEDRPCRQQVLGGAEGLLLRPQLLVAEHGRKRIEVGIGPQHEDAVELGVLSDLVGIDREVIIADRPEVTAIAGIADQRLVALGELALQRGEDRSTIGGVLRGLLTRRSSTATRTPSRISRSSGLRRRTSSNRTGPARTGSRARRRGRKSRTACRSSLPRARPSPST